MRSIPPACELQAIRRNRYEFISEQAFNASAKYGVNSISVLALKPARPE
jgi:hypothetical protein